MKMLKFCLFFLLCFVAVPSFAIVEDSKENSFDIQALRKRPDPQLQDVQSDIKDFYLITVPKSGSNLAVKLLTMLTGREGTHMFHVMSRFAHMSQRDFEIELKKCKKYNQFAWHHTGSFYRKGCNVSGLFAGFSLKHPEYVKFFIIRDLRDVFVSLVSFLDKNMPYVWVHHQLSINTPFDEKLTTCIKYLLNSDIEQSLYWLNDPDTVVLRFEELVGPSGGGTLQEQQETIITCANALGLELTEEKMQYITDNLFGNDSGPSSFTFNKGQIGRWKDCYTEEQKSLFNELWGSYQQAFGYPLAD